MFLLVVIAAVEAKRVPENHRRTDNALPRQAAFFEEFAARSLERGLARVDAATRWLPEQPAVGGVLEAKQQQAPRARRYKRRAR